EVPHHLDERGHHCRFHGRKAECEGDVSTVLPLKADGRVDRFPDNLFRCVGGDFFDLHSAFRTRDKHGPSTIPIDDNAHIQFFGNPGPFFNQQPAHFPAFRTGLVGDQCLADEFLNQTGDGRFVLRNFDTAGFPATTRMNLGLDDKHWCIEFCRPRRSCLGRGNLFPARYRNPELRKQLLSLKFMNVHVFSLLNNRDRRDPRDALRMRMPASLLPASHYSFLVYAGRIMGETTLLTLPCFLASVRNLFRCPSVNFPCGIAAARAADVNPDRFPKTIRSRSELPINRLRPCNPPEASPATKRFFTLVSELVSIFTPPF